METGGVATAIRTESFEGPDGETIRSGFVRLRDEAGLDWVVAVATPRSDFMHEVTGNVRRTTVMAIIACALIVLVGLAVLRRTAGRLGELAEAAGQMSDGRPDALVGTH